MFNIAALHQMNVINELTSFGAHFAYYLGIEQCVDTRSSVPSKRIQTLDAASLGESMLRPGLERWSESFRDSGTSLTLADATRTCNNTFPCVPNAV